MPKPVEVPRGAVPQATPSQRGAAGLDASRSTALFLENNDNESSQKLQFIFSKLHLVGGKKHVCRLRDLH